LDELQELTSRVMEAEETLRAIRSGEVMVWLSQRRKEIGLYTNGCRASLQGHGRDHERRAVTLAADGTILYCNQRLQISSKTLWKKYRIFNPAIHFIKDLQLFEALVERDLKGNSKGNLPYRPEVKIL